MALLKPISMCACIWCVLKQFLYPSQHISARRNEASCWKQFRRIPQQNRLPSGYRPGNQRISWLSTNDVVFHPDHFSPNPILCQFSSPHSPVYINLLVSFLRLLLHRCLLVMDAIGLSLEVALVMPDKVFLQHHPRSQKLLKCWLATSFLLFQFSTIFFYRFKDWIIINVKIIVFIITCEVDNILLCGCVRAWEYEWLNLIIRYTWYMRVH